MTSRAAAMRYARALFDVALREVDAEKVDQELSAFIALLSQHAALQRALTHPAVSVTRKRSAVEALLAKARLSPPLGKLLLLLAERDRLALLPELAEAYRERLMQHQNVLRAEVTTAVPLADDRRRALEQSLAKATGRRVMLTARVDPAIIGGAVTRVGGTVYDGSVVRQLERLKEQLQT